MPSILLLSLGSLCALILIILHALKTHGKRETLIFLSAALLYGILRHLAVWWVTIAYHQTTFPYQFIQTPVNIFGISPQEIVGWMIVSYLGWHIGGAFFSKTNNWRRALGTFLFIASLSLAIENTAIAAHWWFWHVTLLETIFGKAPIIGVIDWGFVGLEFAAPYFLWRERRRIGYLLIIPPLFIGHFASHLALSWPSWSPFPIRDLIHYAILTGIFVPSFLVATDKGSEPGNKNLLIASTLCIIAVLLLVQLFQVKTLHLVIFLAPLVWISAEVVRPKISFASLLHLPGMLLAKTSLPGAFPGIIQLFYTLPSRMVQSGITILILLFFALSMFHARKAEYAYIALFKEANAAYNAGKVPRAEKLLKKAVATSTRHADAYYYLGEALRKEGKWREAAEAYREVLSKYEFNYDAARWLITAYLITNQPQRAQEMTGMLLKIYPGESLLYYLAGNVEARLGNTGKARDYWTTFLSMADNKKDPIMVAQAYKNLGEPKRAESFARKTLKTKPSDWELALWLENHLKKRGDMEAIFTLYHDLAELYPMRAYILKVGRYGLKTGHPDESAKAYRSIASHEPDNEEAKKALEQLDADKTHAR